jgi:hypothetical protein
LDEPLQGDPMIQSKPGRDHTAKAFLLTKDFKGHPRRLLKTAKPTILQPQVLNDVHYSRLIAYPTG